MKKYIIDICYENGGHKMEYGLALSGGGARGAYHAGVYRAINEMGLNIRSVTGTSIGAVTGALIAAGDGERLQRLWGELSIKAITGSENPGIKLLGGCDLKYVYEIISQCVNEEKIRNSSIHFGFELLDGYKNVEVFIEDIPKGRLAEYLTAAVCMPIFKPRRIDGRKLIDAGMGDNMPVDMLICDGCKNIVASDDKGIGRLKKITKSDVNIIEVKYRKPEGGILDFSRGKTMKSAQHGYYDCRRAFGDISGKLYCFENEDYMRAAHCFGTDMLDKIERAAAICRIDSMRIYSVDALVQHIADAYRKSKKIRNFILEKRFNCIIKYIEKNYPNIL